MNRVGLGLLVATLVCCAVPVSAFADVPNDQACLQMLPHRAKKMTPRPVKLAIADAEYKIKVCTAAIKEWKRTDVSIARAYMSRAQAWYAEQEYAKAIADVTHAIQADPKATGYRAIRGDFYVASEKYDQALSDYAGALPSKPMWNKDDQATLYTKRGAVYGLMGRPDEAIAELDKAIALDPRRARAYYNRGLAWKLKGSYGQALRDYQSALDANPADPNILINRGAQWRKKTAAAKAEILYQDITFSIDMDTSGAGIQIAAIQETRFGKALLVSQNDMPASDIMFNGKKVFSDEDGMYVGMCGYFRTKNGDVILVSTNPGGSATPDSPMYFLIIHSASRVQVLTHPAFVADTPNTDELKKWMDKEGRIFVKLGFRDGKEMVAELNSGKLVVHAYSRKGVPLASDLCHWLYENGMESCKSDVAHDQGCSRYANPAEIYGPTVAMTQMTFIRNQPGYSQAGFNKSCLAWCKGESISYRQFSKTSCGKK